MCLELCINLTLGLLETKHLTNGDQWKGLAVTETYVFDGIYMFLPPPIHRRRDC